LQNEITFSDEIHFVDEMLGKAEREMTVKPS
jgi:hypothetical protein